MRNTLFSINTTLRFLFVCCCSVLLLNNAAYAQCGLSSFNEAGGPFTPTTTFNQVSTGSGTYVDFNVTAGNIYSFYYDAPSANTGYNFDMTVSSTSTALPYNNGLTPIPNSWTGGISCPATGRPSSAEWYSTYTGVVRINVKSWNGTCNDWVAGQNSAVIDYKVCTPSGDPGSGSNVWNVDAYATTDLSIPNVNARYGYYVDNIGTDFNTANWWNPASNPSAAAGWTGCQMPNDNFLTRARRTGFPCDRYTITVNNADDNIQVYLNGNQIYAGSGIGSPTAAGDPNGYVLGPTDNIEIRLVDLCGPGQCNVSVTPVGVSALNGGTIGGVADGSNICEGGIAGNFTNVTSASGGTPDYNNGGALAYDWQASPDGVNFSSTGVTTPGWNSTNVVPAGAVFVVRRAVTDRCGHIAYSNTITLYGKPEPNGSLSPQTQTTCPGTQVPLTVNLSPGTGPFNITYADNSQSYSVNGVNNGDLIYVTPNGSGTTTPYNLTYISDSYGCVRTTGFNGGALVNTIPAISISNVAATDVLCYQSTDGTITITANGGQSPLIYSIDNGNTFVTTNVFTGLPIGGYDVVVQDNYGCGVAYPTTIVIGQPTDITQTVAKTDASCSGVYDGTITVSASGGTPPYSYSLGGPTQPNNVFSGLSAGHYITYVYDAHNCVDTSSIDIASTYIVGLDTSNVVNVSCFGASDGAFTVQLSGGVPPFSYSISGIGYQNSGTFSNLSAGTYIVIGKDSRGCSESVTINIAQPGQVTATIDSIVNVLCASSSNGGIYITPGGGTPGYTFHWSNGVTTEDNTNLAGGTYNVTVTDSRGCTASNGATISQPALLSLNIAQYNDPNCHNDSTGAIDITANGGVAPYSYTWNTSAPTTEDQVNLPAGTYTATVTDANGCQANISQVLNNPTSITSTVTHTNVSCHGAADGTATVTAAGGTQPYQYQWSNFQTYQTAVSLVGTRYYVIVTDHNGCNTIDSADITEPALLTASVAITNISCYNANDGAVDVTVAGGTGPYTYIWNSGQTTEDISGLSAGTYVITVTDAHGCQATASAVINNPSEIVVGSIVTNALCYGDTNGKVSLVLSGGTPGYTYLWSNGATTQNIMNLDSDTYYFTVTDSKGCTKSDSAHVNQPSQLYTSGIIKNVSCAGLCDGAVITTPYGGTLPYSYNWSGGQSTENLVQLCGGNNYLTVTDANGCNVVSLYIIVAPQPLVTTVATTNITCFGTCNGTATVTSTGGTSPYEVLWNNFSADAAQTGLCAGKYTVLVTDSNGCHKYDSATITQPLEIQIAGTVTNVLCNGFNSGAVNTTVTGGIPPYTYAWTGGSSGANLTGVSAGTYGLTVTDANGCVKTASFVISETQGIHTTVSVSQPTCSGGNNGFIQVDVTGGFTPYVYNWSTTTPQHGATATNLAAGTYALTVTDANSCSATVSANLASPNPLVVTTTSTASKCYNSATGTVTATVTGGVAPYHYQLNGVLQDTNVFTHLFPGTYFVVATDVNGCSGSSTFTVAPGEIVTVDLSAPNAVILTGMETQLVADAHSTGSPIVQYIWTPAALDSASIFDFTNCGTDSNTCSTPYVHPPFTTLITVAVMNQDSCFAYDTVTITVKNEPSAFIPSAFTPNGDGLNDRFEFDVLGANMAEMSIYNRWGERIYYNANQPNGITGSNGWDGTKDGKAAPEDTYLYRLKLTYFDGTVKNRTGTVNIMR